MIDHDDTSSPQPYEEVKLRSSIVSDTGYAVVRFKSKRQRNEKIYENFEPQPQDDQNQYEALRQSTAASGTNDDHLYATAQPRY